MHHKFEEPHYFAHFPINLKLYLHSDRNIYWNQEQSQRRNSLIALIECQLHGQETIWKYISVIIMFCRIIIMLKSGTSPNICSFSYLIGLRAISNPWITALLAEAAMNIAPSGCTLRNAGMNVVPFDDETPHLVWHSNLCWLISINRSVPRRTKNQEIVCWDKR